MFALRKIPWNGTFQRINPIESCSGGLGYLNRYRVNYDWNSVGGLRFASRGRRNTGEESLVKLAFQMFENHNHNHETEDPPIIIMHGLLGSKNNWSTTAKNLLAATKNRRIMAIDARNHGDSPHTKEFSYLLMVSDVIKFMAEQNLEKASFIGHSMGGRVLMLLAMMYPSKVHSMVVVDISPFHSIHTMYTFMKLSKTIKELDLDPYMKLSDARAHATTQLKQYIEDIQLIRFIVSNMVQNDEQSSWRWKFNLDAIIRNFESEMLTLPLMRPDYKGPALFVAGKKSDYFQKEEEPDILDLFETADFVYLDAGHWVHIDRPQEFVSVVSRFFNDEASPKNVK